MKKFTDRPGWILGSISLLGGGLVAMAGLACLAVGLTGLFLGFHGGLIAAGLLAAFGAALLFVGYFCGYNGFHSNVARRDESKITKD
jgi:hypothetical protein